MIFDVFWNPNGELKHLPTYEFKCEEQIAIKKIIIEWNDSSQRFLGLISSDLVDRNEANPRQQLCTFIKRDDSAMTDVEFTSPVFYDIQKHYLHEATVSIDSLFNRKIPGIKNIYIQFLAK